MSIRKALLRLSVYSVTLKALLRSTKGSIKAFFAGRSQVIDLKETAAIDPANPELRKLELHVQQMSAPGVNLTSFTGFTSKTVQLLLELQQLELQCVQQMSVI